MDTIIIPISDFVRKAGLYSERLTRLEKIILTKEGRPFAEVKLSPEERNRNLLKLKGSWNGKLFANDKIWNEPWKHVNRKTQVSW